MVVTILFIETILIARLTKNSLFKVRAFFLSIIMALTDKFLAAVKVIQSLPKDGPYQPSNSTKLRFYSLYKQSTEGPCVISKPPFYDIVGRAKWDAWAKLGDISKEDAMNAYIDELKNIVETMSFNGDVQEFLDSIGPFYEFVSLHGEEMSEIKETLERVTSSSSSTSSPTMSTDSSTESSPMKHINSNSSSVLEKPCANGYLTNHVHSDSDDQDPISTKYCPPSAPVHRRSIPNCSRDTHESGFYENGETSDEVLEIEKTSVERSMLRPHSSDTVMSGTDSDKYYSGDSDLDLEEQVSRSNVISSAVDAVASSSRNYYDKSRSNNKLAQDCGDSGFSQLEESPQGQTSELVVRNTVERLNRDVDHILARLRILEAAYAVNPGGDTAPARRRRILFGDVSRGTLTLIFSWPFVAYFIIKLISWWISRRKRRNLRQITG